MSKIGRAEIAKPDDAFSNHDANLARHMTGQIDVPMLMRRMFASAANDQRVPQSLRSDSEKTVFGISGAAIANNHYEIPGEAGPLRFFGSIAQLCCQQVLRLPERVDSLGSVLLPCLCVCAWLVVLVVPVLRGISLQS